MVKTDKNHMAECRHALPDLTICNGTPVISYLCCRDHDNIRETTASACENCPDFNSRYIQYPITVSVIENRFTKPYEQDRKCGMPCAVRPVDDEKTYLGIYLGEMPMGLYSSYKPADGILVNQTLSNPGLYVFELRKIVYGMECWWKELKSADDLKEITDRQIHDTWYVKLLKELLTDEKES